MHMACLTLFCLAVLSCGARADDIAIGSDRVAVNGFGISKSTSGRLVNVLIPKPLAKPREIDKGVYIPAGTRIALLDRSFKDKDGEPWNLVSTEDGIVAFIKGQAPQKAPYYWTKAQIDQFFTGNTSQIAIVQAPQLIHTKTYGDVTLTASEIYRLDPDASAPEDKVAIILDRSKLGDLWTANETVAVPDEVLAVIGKDAFEDVSDLEQPFILYDPVNDIMESVEATLNGSNIPDSRTVRQQVLAFLSNRFVTSKTCDSVIKFKLETSVDAAVGLSGLLSPVEAKLKLSGNVEGSTEYGKGEEFKIVRVKRPGDENIYEIKTSSNREACSLAPTSRILVAGTDGVDGEINEGNLAQAGFGENTKGSPVYTCRWEFFRLRDILSNKASLPHPISTFVVANLAEFSGASDPSTCSPAKERQP